MDKRVHIKEEKTLPHNCTEVIRYDGIVLTYKTTTNGFIIIEVIVGVA